MCVLRFVRISSVPRSAAAPVVILTTPSTGTPSVQPSVTMDTLLVAAQPARRHPPRLHRSINPLGPSLPTKAGQHGATFNAGKARVGRPATAIGRPSSKVNQFYPLPLNMFHP